MRQEIKTVIGAIPYQNFKHRIRIIDQLKREFGKVRINFDNGLVFYEYFEKSSWLMN